MNYAYRVVGELYYNNAGEAILKRAPGWDGGPYSPYINVFNYEWLTGSKDKNTKRMFRYQSGRTVYWCLNSAQWEVFMADITRMDATFLAIEKVERVLPQKNIWEKLTSETV